MVRIPAGEFVMGASQEQLDAVVEFGFSPRWMEHLDLVIRGATPAHTVYLDAFEIDLHEVTNSQYGRFVHTVGLSPPAFVTDQGLTRPDNPVVGVSWEDAAAFCAWAGKRLPTEAEWEKAARGVEGYDYPWGDAWDPAKLRTSDGVSGRDLAGFDDWADWIDETGSPSSSPGIAGTVGAAAAPGPVAVGSHPEGASPYGVMDMAGNVWEWVADWFDADYYKVSPQRNPTGPETGQRRVLRGGGWDAPRVMAYTWFREDFMTPSEKRDVTGFRCARDG